MRATPTRVLAATGGSLIALLLAIAGGLLLGVEHVDLRRALTEPSSVDAAILFGTRLTRVLLGVAVGAALAPAGVAFQALLRNPLADPFVLGVSGGATVTATLAIVLGADHMMAVAWSLPLWAFAGALGSVAAVYYLGRVRGRLVPNVALLAGVVLNSLAAAVVVAIRLVATPQAAHQALYWLTGSLAATDGAHLIVVSAYVLVGLGLLWREAVAMNVLALGVDSAHTIGVDTERARRRIFIAASLVTGAAVAFAGPIGFVGILVPHTLRAILGPDHRLLLPTSALLGAAFLVACDTGARLAFLALDTEPTVGVITALLGAPFFLVLLRRRGAGGF